MRRRQILVGLGACAALTPFAALAQVKRPLVGYLAASSAVAAVRSSTTFWFPQWPAGSGLR